MMKSLVMLGLVTFFFSNGFCSILDNFLITTPYARPFLSEIHSPITKLEIGYNKSYSEFDLLESEARFNRPVVELHLGTNIPLFAFTSGSLDSPDWSISISAPVSIHVLEDMFGPVTAPVIDTDYRFGSPQIRGIYFFKDSTWLRNLSFSWLPIYHECTHLGDEITIYRITENFPITRINVSYEFTELQLTLNDPNGTKQTNHAFRVGGIYRLSDRGNGWFSVRKDAELTTDINIADSKVRTEYYAQYQGQWSTTWLSSEKALQIVSFESRYRLRYGYPLFKRQNDHWETMNVTEKMLWNFNMYAGWKFYPADHKDALGVYFHAYKGMNPYGQLRNYPGYPFFALSIIYDI